MKQYSKLTSEHLSYLSLYHPKRSALPFKHDWRVFSPDVLWIQQVFPVLWTGLNIMNYFMVCISSQYALILPKRAYSQSKGTSSMTEEKQLHILLQ